MVRGADVGRGAARLAELRIERLTGGRIAGVLEDIARLRIAVFREWPYLYEGSLDYEHDYLADFASAADAVIVAAFAGDAIVGAATASPLAGHGAAFGPVLAEAGYDPARVFYFGEAVLLPAWRGQGIGHAFFDHREAHARACCGVAGGYTHAAFCAVVRSPDDPRVPAGYRPLDAFWLKRGFRPAPGVFGSYRWREFGAAEESDHAMQFWIKPL